MFAVKGWAVDAATLKPQTDDGSSRKRKRGKDGDAAQQQSQPDVGKMWEKHFEGKTGGKTKAEKRKERKRQRLQSGQSAVEAPSVKPEVASAKADDSRQAKNLSKQQQKKKDKQKPEPSQQNNGSEDLQATVKSAQQSGPPPPTPPSLQAGTKLTPMQAAMRQKLISARFRHLNQTLYTAPSATALDLFAQNPEMFEDYHAGFRQQVEVWPENPVDAFIATIRSRGRVKSPKYKGKGGPSTPSEGPSALPRTQGVCTIADLGCGDARLAQTLKAGGDTTKMNLKVQSFDLHSPSPLVTKADISNLPIPDGSVDVAIFCLALMGTNWIFFIEEVYRVLHWKGELWIAEIKSRFGRAGKKGKVVEHSVGSKRKNAAMQKARDAKEKEDAEIEEQTALRTEVDGVESKADETDVSAFIDVLRRRGFVLKDREKSVDLGNKMFVRMEFVKAAVPTKGKGVEQAARDGGGKLQQGKKKFVEKVEEDIATDDEAKVLKPCLYKLR